MKQRKKSRQLGTGEDLAVATSMRFHNALRSEWVRVRYVKFSPEEMAMDAPVETKSGKWIFVGRGPLAIGAKPSDARSVYLDPDVARYFKNDRHVNETLRRAAWLMQVQKAIDSRVKRV